MSYRIAGIDVHKKTLAVVVSDRLKTVEPRGHRSEGDCFNQSPFSLPGSLREQTDFKISVYSPAHRWIP